MTGTAEVLREGAEHHAKEPERLDARRRHPAVVDFAHCVRAWGGLVARGQLSSPREYVGAHLHFRDGTTSLVFRETLRRAPTLEPAVLVIQFRLAALGSNRWAHAAFRRECVLHTPLFAGFPGFRSKLWADDVTTGIYRGIYEWEGAEAARAYATRMVGLLAPFSNADTARFQVVGGLRRDTFLRDPQAASSDGADGWWRIEQPVEPSTQPRFPDVALKHRLSDASYRFYDRGRHKAAFEAAAKPGTAPDFSSLQGCKYALLVTFRKDGTAVPTPVWFALLDDRHLVVRTEERTAKVRRLRSDARARVFPCDPRGKPLGPGVEGRVRVLPAGVECERAEAALDRHYGRVRRIYEKLMADESGMVYLEVVPAAQESDGEHHLP